MIGCVQVNYRGTDKFYSQTGLKKQLKGRHFSSDAEVIAASEIWLDGQSSKFFLVVCQSKSLGTVASFFPGLDKDLSASRYKARSLFNDY